MNKVIFVRSWEKPPHSTFEGSLSDGLYVSESEASSFEEQIYVNLFNQNEWDLQWCGITNILEYKETLDFLEGGCVVFICINNAIAYVEDIEYLEQIKNKYPNCIVVGLTHWNEEFTLYPERAYFRDTDKYASVHPQQSDFYKNFDALVVPSTNDVSNIYSYFFSKPVFSCLPPIPIQYIDGIKNNTCLSCPDPIEDNTIVVPRPQPIGWSNNDSSLLIHTLLAETEYNVCIFTQDGTREGIDRRDFLKVLTEDPRIITRPRLSYSDYLATLHQSLAVVNYTNATTWMRSALDATMVGKAHIGSPGVLQNWLYPKQTLPYSHNNLLDIVSCITDTVSANKSLCFQAETRTKKNSLSIPSIQNQFKRFLFSIKGK